MAAHDYHEALPGYDVRQILHDGCAECERRGANITVAIDHLDPQRFAAAWRRTAAWHSHDAWEGGVGPVSDAEVGLLRVLYAVQVQLERHGVPVGCVPSLSGVRVTM